MSTVGYAMCVLASRCLGVAFVANLLHVQLGRHRCYVHQDALLRPNPLSNRCGDCWHRSTGQHRLPLDLSCDLSLILGEQQLIPNLHSPQHGRFRLPPWKRAQSGSQRVRCRIVGCDAVGSDADQQEVGCGSVQVYFLRGEFALFGASSLLFSAVRGAGV